MAKECRGIVWDASGKCVCLPFEKFFNLGENSETQEQDMLWNDFYSVAEKRDGSMITSVVVKGEVFLKTKKSFYSDVAYNATQAMDEHMIEFCLLCDTMGMTPIFEFTSQSNEIVIDYGDVPKFTLLAIRNIKTGEYSPRSSMEYFGELFHLPVVRKFGMMPLSTLKSQMETKTDFEGYVISFANNIRVKMKTAWYMRLHHAKTDLRVRDVAEMCVDETIDDVKSACSGAGLSLDPIEEIERQVAFEFVQIIEQTEELYGWIRMQESRKEAAIKFRGNMCFGLAMKMVDCSEPDFKKFWKTNYLKAYSLRNVYGNFNGVTEDG
jgi:T4 RnlA family RNA ligase